MAKKNNTVISPLEPVASEADSGLSPTMRLKGNYQTTRVMLGFDDIIGDTLVTIHNWRSPLQLDLRAIELASQLKEQGQQTPLMVRPLGLDAGEAFDADEVGNLGIIRGHSRSAGFKLLAKQLGRKEFEKLFPEGVACDVVEGLSESEAALLATDNASSVNMETPYDWHMAGNGLIRAGVSRGDMMLALENVTEKLFPIKTGTDNGDRVVALRQELEAVDAELTKLQQKIDGVDPEAAGAEGVIDALTTMRDQRVKEREAKVNEERKLIEDIRRGLADRIQNHWNAGPLADYWLHQSVTGKPHPDCPENLVPIFAAVAYNVKGDIPALSKAALEDANVKRGALSEAQRGRVMQGAAFKVAFDKLLARARKKIADSDDKEETVRPKAKSGKEMVAIGDARESVGLRKVFDVLTGKVKLSSEEETKAFQMVDGLLTIAEVVSQHDPDFWREEVVTRYRDLRKKLQKQAANALTDEGDEEQGEETSEGEAPEEVKETPTPAKKKAGRSRGRKARH